MAVAILAVAAGLIARGVSLLTRTELATQDARFKIRGADKPPANVVLITIDDKTQAELQLRYPFPRSLHARLIKVLTQAGVRAVGYDIEFLAPTTPRQDRALLRAIQGSRSLVLETTKITPGGQPVNVFGATAIRAAGAELASGISSAESDGEFRRFDYSQEGIPTFPIAVAKASGAQVSEPPPGGTPAWIDYVGPPGTITRYSFVDVLEGRVPADALQGKTVIVGATSPDLQDLHPTPPRGQLMPGAEIQANAVATVLDGFPLRNAGAAVNIALIILLGTLAPLLAVRLSALKAIAITLAVVVAFLVAAQLAFNSGRILEVTYPLFAATVGTVGTGVVETATVSRERWRTKRIFARYMDPTVVDLVLESREEGFRLPSTELEATVLFCDLRGFTAFGKDRSAREVVGMVNRYLTEVSEVIRDHGGTIVTFLGDGVMAVFGAPLPMTDHADRALAAAQGIVSTALPRLNDWLARGGAGEPFGVGVGLATGTVVSGSIGSGWRLEYTATGGPTNLAAKLEAHSKKVGRPVLLNDATRQALSLSSQGEVEHLGLQEIVPGATLIEVWAAKAVTSK